MILVLQSPGLEPLARGLAREGTVDSVSVDVTDMRAVRAVVEAVRPEAVILSAWRDAEGAEADPDRAFRVSAEAAINLAAAALEFECRPVFLSVADVFGQVGGPFDVSDAPAASAVFAEAALRGEQFLRKASRGQGLVVRSGPWIESIEAALRAGETAPTRSKVSPIWAEDLGVALRAWVGSPGLVHAASEGRAIDIAALYRTVGEWFGLPARVSASESALALTPTLRPSDAPLPDWERPPAPAAWAEDEPEPDVTSRATGRGADEADAAVRTVDSQGVSAELRALGPGEAWSLPGPGQLWVLEGKVLLEGEQDAILGAGQGGGFEHGTVRPVLPSRLLFVRPTP